MRALWIAAGVALLAALALFAYRQVSSNPVTDGQQRSSSATPATGPEHTTPEAQDKSLASSPGREVDLFAEVTSLMPKSEAGDARASYRIASVYEECWQYAINPSGFESDIKLKSSVRKDLAPMFKSVGNTVSQRCGRFAGSDIGPVALRGMLQRAATQGSTAAQVRLFAESAASGGISGEELQGNVDRVLASRDPDAFAALAPVMGRMSDGVQSAIAPLPAGSDLAEAAWNVASCRLGRNCSGSSAAVIGMCLNGGVNCELRDIETFYKQAVLPPADAAKLGQLVNQLVQGTKP